MTQFVQSPDQPAHATASLKQTPPSTPLPVTTGPPDQPSLDLSPSVYDSYYETPKLVPSPRRKSSSPSVLLARLRRRSSSTTATTTTAPTPTLNATITTPTDTTNSMASAQAISPPAGLSDGSTIMDQRLKKYQNDLSVREREREAVQRERDFLRSSLRGSQRLQALESSKLEDPESAGLGHANPAFSPSPPLSPKQRHSTATSDLQFNELTSSSIDIESIMRKMDEVLKGPGSADSSLLPVTEEDITNIGIVRDYLRDRNFKDSLDIYTTINRCLNQGMLLDNPLPYPTSSDPPLLQLVTDVTKRLNASLGPSYTIPNLSGANGAKISDLADMFQEPKFFNLLLTYDEISQLLLPSPTNIRSPKDVNYRNGSLMSPYLKGDDHWVDNDISALGAAVENGGAPGPNYLDRTFQYPENNIKIVKIEKGPDPLGATIRNEGDSVVVARIVKNGSAEKTGLLREGDEILEVNGIEMRGKSVNEVCNLLANLTGTLTFIIVPNRAIDTNDHHHPNFQDDTPMSVRAYFSYDPEEDLYIPCRELGLSFQKGDILHIINQDDANWWQAYREGEDVYGLAGLIPSKSFQIQRETLKMTLFSEAQNRHGKKRRKQGADKRKNGHALLSLVPGYSPYNPSSTLGNVNPYFNNNGNMAANNSTAQQGQQNRDQECGNALCGADSLALRLCINSDCRKKRGKNSYLDNNEYECDEILTYEEVELYYPRPERKRPIVLIGPPDIGRHELRQKLMENFPSRFSAAVPHTSRAQKFGEIDGQDYHFLNRQAFETDIMAGKFVEHGEFEKNLYGTSLAAIKRVVDSGKSCILNLHPQSLKILHHSDLMPYVVFVAPPNIEKLKIIQEKRGVHKKEEELAEIIEKAREIEDNFGHYFDMIIINTDLNKTYNQLLEEINRIECEPQWIPKLWLHLHPSSVNESASQSSQFNLNNSQYPNRTHSGSHKFIP